MFYYKKKFMSIRRYRLVNIFIVIEVFGYFEKVFIVL